MTALESNKPNGPTKMGVESNVWVFRWTKQRSGYVGSSAFDVYEEVFSSVKSNNKGGDQKGSTSPSIETAFL